MAEPNIESRIFHRYSDYVDFNDKRFGDDALKKILGAATDEDEVNYRDLKTWKRYYNRKKKDTRRKAKRKPKRGCKCR